MISALGSGENIVGGTRTILLLVNYDNPWILFIKKKKTLDPPLLNNELFLRSKGIRGSVASKFSRGAICSVRFVVSVVLYSKHTSTTQTYTPNTFPLMLSHSILYKNKLFTLLGPFYAAGYLRLISQKSKHCFVEILSVRSLLTTDPCGHSCKQLNGQI